MDYLISIRVSTPGPELSKDEMEVLQGMTAAFMDDLNDNGFAADESQAHIGKIDWEGV